MLNENESSTVTVKVSKTNRYGEDWRLRLEKIRNGNPWNMSIGKARPPKKSNTLLLMLIFTVIRRTAIVKQIIHSSCIR